MTDAPATTYTAFDGFTRIANGPLATVALAVKRFVEDRQAFTPLTFDDTTGKVFDLDLSGPEELVLARVEPQHLAAEVRPRGRPKLGVVAREVTLLPRHWDWLARQPGGASVALRKLVEAARRESADKMRNREAVEAAYRFMSAVAGDLPGFEEAIRALFAHDMKGFAERIAAWPDDVRDYAMKLAVPANEDAVANAL